MPKTTPSGPKPAAPAAKAAKAVTKANIGQKTVLAAKGLVKVTKTPRAKLKPLTAGKNRSGPRPRTSQGKLAAGPDDPKYTEITPIVLTAIFAALAETGRITQVCKDLRVNYPTYHALKNADKDVNNRHDEAMKLAFSGMEDEVRRRAFRGVSKPVYQGGVLVGHIQEYSDRLAEFMIRAHKPEVYSPKTTAAVEHSGNISVAATYAQMSDEALNEQINKKLRFLGMLRDTGKDGDDQDPEPLKDSPEGGGEDV